MSYTCSTRIIFTRPDDVDNALPFVTQTEICQAKRLNVVFKGEALYARVGLLNELSHVLEVVARGRWYIVIGCSESTIRPSDFAIRVPKAFERLGRCHLGDKLNSRFCNPVSIMPYLMHEVPVFRMN